MPLYTDKSFDLSYYENALRSMKEAHIEPPRVRIVGSVNGNRTMVLNWDGECIPWIQKVEIQIEANKTITATLILTNVALDLDILASQVKVEKPSPPPPPLG